MINMTKENISLQTNRIKKMNSVIICLIIFIILWISGIFVNLKLHQNHIENNQSRIENNQFIITNNQTVIKTSLDAIISNQVKILSNQNIIIKK